MKPQAPSLSISAEEIITEAARHADADLLRAALKTIGASPRCTCGATVCLLVLGGESFRLERRIKTDADGNLHVNIHQCEERPS